MDSNVTVIMFGEQSSLSSACLTRFLVLCCACFYFGPLQLPHWQNTIPIGRMTSDSMKIRQQQDDPSESLMTEKALRLSLSPPRCPPVGTVHHSLLLGVPLLSNTPYAEHHQEATVAAHSDYHSQQQQQRAGIRESIMHLVYDSHQLVRNHPHLGPHDAADQVTRFLGTLLPLSWQNHVRDTGGFRSIFDSLVELSIPLGAVANPRAAHSFLHLTQQVQTIRYGEPQHKSQIIDVFVPEHVARNDWTGMVFFVHGGAWGSGKPWYYRLVAQAFLEWNMAVAIVGYRVYPDGDTSTQVADLEAAQLKLTEVYPDLCGPDREKRPIGFCVMGHSSGAHIALLMLVDQAKRMIQADERSLVKAQYTTNMARPGMKRTLFDRFVGISGPYDISHHFDYEAARGVEGQ